MRAILVSMLLFSVTLSAKEYTRTNHRFECKTPAIAATCYWTHGRLQVHMGTPAVRLWKTGTHRILGIYSGAGSEKIDEGDNEHPVLPINLRVGEVLWGDFEVCPLEPEQKGVMQRACIESARDVFIEKD